ncbi:MAG: lysylphosphatidylglycerol synthase domain-containing protein [Burkholderiaceae bacterium]
MTRTRWIAAASIAAGVVLLAVLVLYTPWHLLAERVASVPWPGWVGATLGMSATYALRAGRLRAEWLWKLRTLNLGYRECLQITLLHNAAINILPMRSGEASYSFLLHRRWGVGLGDATASLLWLRLQDMLVLGVLGIAILVPAPLPWRIGFAVAAIAAAATLLPLLVRRVHVHARWSRARAHARAPRSRKAWHLVAKVAAAFRAARGGAAAWGFAIANWVLKLGIVGVLLASLANLPLGAGFCGALGGELAGVLPIQAPAGVGTYEAGVALGTRAHLDETTSGSTISPAAPAAANADNVAQRATPGRLIFGAALAVHALMLVVALGTALAFSLIVRPVRAPESQA